MVDKLLYQRNDVPDFAKHFASAQERFKKGTFAHINEIHAVQKYFETTYMPDDLSEPFMTPQLL